MREVERRKLNVIEGLILAALVGLAGSNLMLRDTVVQVRAQNAAMVGQIDSLSKQMNGLSMLTTQVAELKVRVDGHDEALREQRRMGGLR